jgi:hypothetical protein
LYIRLHPRASIMNTNTRSKYLPTMSHPVRSAFLLLLATLPAAHTQHTSKRGLARLDDHATDTSLLISQSSPLSWYYNWSPYPNTGQIPQNSLEFVPLIHGIDTAGDSNTAGIINSIPQNSRHLLSFNEPDGTTGSGGSAISPEDAAKSYMNDIVPYRNGKNRRWNISHPVTTGSPNGLDWLRRFNESCYDLDHENGCPIDFITAHWYGNFDGLAAWLGTLNDFYNTNTSRTPPLRIWITEMALPQQDADATLAMMNQTLPYLDKLDYVERYAWFGAVRSNDANAWTGKSVALFDNDGGLTELGALYMGDGFKKGQQGSKAEGSAASGTLVNDGLMLVLFILITLSHLL